MQGRKVLVTGAGGFIGSHLCERLVEAGARVRALVHYNGAGRRGWLDHSPLVGEMEVVAGDVRDREQMVRWAAGRDRVFHLAALIAIPYSYQAVDSVFAVNLGGTLNVCQACLQGGVGRLVQMSSSEVYGSARYVPMDENHPLTGQSPYSASKIAADAAAYSTWASFGLDLVVARPFNTFGPRQSPRAIIPSIILQLLDHPDYLDLGLLSPTRDLNPVASTVAGLMALAEGPSVDGAAVNIGSGRECSMGELAQRIAGIMGAVPEIRTDEGRLRPGHSEVNRLCADATLARARFGFEPTQTLEEGLEQTIAWFTDHRELFSGRTYSL